MKPAAHMDPKCADFQTMPMIAPTGFREYDVRWRYPEDINLPGLTALGLGLGTQMHQRGLSPRIVVGHDYRSYSLAVKNALMLGLVKAGIQVLDIGLSLSPMAYFAQFHLDVDAVAMVTASHNPNGWTGVKMGFDKPCTHGADDMAELRDIVLNGKGVPKSGGGIQTVDDMRDAYLDDVIGNFKLSRPLRIVCATGNGTASAFAPAMLERIGAEVIGLHTDLDHSFPYYNPNPEALEMLHDMAAVVRKHDADLALGFDGDGDRGGVVDNSGTEIFADKLGLILARHWAKTNPGAHLVADVKSTGLFATDPVLQDHGISTEYWKTGHSHMKRRVRETGALAGIERSAHFYLSGPLGRGYDCGLGVAMEVCKLLDRNPDRTLADFRMDLPTTFDSPTFCPGCPDALKYDVLANVINDVKRHIDATGAFAGMDVAGLVTVNGLRVTLSNGSWGLIRASSNTPNLVVVAESTQSRAELDQILNEFSTFLAPHPEVEKLTLEF